jgi:cytochrome c556
MFQKAKQIGRATWPALVLILAASAVSSGAIHAESIVPALHATMRTMRTSLAQLGDFAKGDGEHLVIETSKLLAAVKDGNKEAIGQQVVNTRKACSACRAQFRD